MNVDEAIVCEQAAHIHRNMPTGIIGSFVVASLLVAVFWPVGNHVALFAWLLAGGLLALWRLADWRTYDAKKFSLAQARQWLYRATRGAALSGCVWGLGSLLFLLPPEFLYQLLFEFIIALLGVSAMFSYSAYFPTFIAFFASATLPAVIGLIAQRTALHVEVGVGFLIFMIVNLRFYASFNRMFMKSLQLGFENLALVDELTVQKEAAESANLQPVTATIGVGYANAGALDSTLLAYDLSKGNIAPIAIMKNTYFQFVTN